MVRVFVSRAITQSDTDSDKRAEGHDVQRARRWRPGDGLNPIRVK